MITEIPKKIDRKVQRRILKNYSIKNNTKKIAGTFDVFITNSGYEVRTLGLLRTKHNLKIRNSIIFIFHPKESNLYLKNLENLESIREYIKTISKITEIQEIDPTNPWQFRKMMLDLCKKYHITSSSRVLVDITSFTRVFLYELIYSLYKSGCEFSLVYTEPKDYAKILPSGVNKIIITPSFIGEPRPNKKAFLILFFGWETERTREIFENYNSDEHVGIFGVAPIDKKHLAWQQQSYERNKKLMANMRNIEQCSTLDVYSIFNCLTRIYIKKYDIFHKKKEKVYFAISGLGPKIQNVASCLFAIRHKDVQLIYGAPSYWGPIRTVKPDEPVESIGIGDVYIYGPFSKKMINKL